MMLVIGLLCFWPLLFVNCRYRNSKSKQARLYYQVSMGLLLLHGGCAGIWCVIIIVGNIIGAAQSG